MLRERILHDGTSSPGGDGSGRGRGQVGCGSACEEGFCLRSQDELHAKAPGCSYYIICKGLERQRHCAWTSFCQGRVHSLSPYCRLSHFPRRGGRGSSPLTPDTESWGARLLDLRTSRSGDVDPGWVSRSHRSLPSVQARLLNNRETVPQVHV